MSEYIKRENVLAKIDEFAKRNIAHGFPVDVFDIEMMKKMVEKLPAADVAPVVHGHWIRQDESFTRFKCSNPECGIENCNGFENYCPNCGAKMDEGKGDFIER